MHLYGRPADLDAIALIARHHGLRLIEDCAQAAGARYRDRRVGSIGDVGCFSFYPTKNLGAIGDGGMVTTSDAALAARVRRLRQYGWNDARETENVGVNSRLDPLQAAILAAKLPHLDDGQYTPRGHRTALFTRPYWTSTCRAGNRQRARSRLSLIRYCLRDRDALAVASREARSRLGNPLSDAGPRHKGYAERVRIPKRRTARHRPSGGRILSLPMYPELSDGDVDQAIAAIRGFYDA